MPQLQKNYLVPILLLVHYKNSKKEAEKLQKELIKNKTKVYLVKGDLAKEQDLKKIIKFSKLKLKYFDLKMLTHQYLKMIILKIFLLKVGTST